MFIFIFLISYYDYNIHKVTALKFQFCKSQRQKIRKLSPKLVSFDWNSLLWIFLFYSFSIPMDFDLGTIFYPQFGPVFDPDSPYLALYFSRKSSKSNLVILFIDGTQIIRLDLSGLLDRILSNLDFVDSFSLSYDSFIWERY